MHAVQTEIRAENGDFRSVAAKGSVAGALRTLILRLADQYPNDPDLQNLSEAVYAVEVKP